MAAGFTRYFAVPRKQVVDDGVPDLWNVDSFDATVTTSTFNSGDPSLPFFVDGGTSSLYTNFAVPGGSQKTGFAARITLNAALKDDPSRLVAYAAGVAAGDPTRPNYLEQQLTAATRKFSPASGIGTTAGPYSGRLLISFGRRFRCRVRTRKAQSGSRRARTSC